MKKTGFDIVRIHPYNFNNIGEDAYKDISHFLAGTKEPVIFDVGANVGQSVDKFAKKFPASIIHSFEPSPATYQKLNNHCADLPLVNTWNCGVGSRQETLKFQENEYSVMSSFLAPGKLAMSKVVRTEDVPLITLNVFAEEHNIDFIHILKSDTQGFDFEVLKGANELMQQNRIGLIYFECIFSDMYKNLPKFHDVFRYLDENNFDLVALYEPHFQEERMSWTDVLFINRQFSQKRKDTKNNTDNTNITCYKGKRPKPDNVFP